MRTFSTMARWCALALAGGLVLLLSACGGSASVPAIPTDTPASPTSTPTAAPLPTLQAHIISHLFDSIAPNSNSPIADLTCPAGYVVAGGGVNSGYSSIVPMQNAPLNASTWRAEIFNTSTTQTIAVQVQVDCLRASGVTLTSQIVTRGLGTVDVGGTATATIACPAGAVVGGGGLVSGYPTFNVVWNAPVSPTSWQAQVFNFGTAPINAQAQVACLSAPGLSAQVITRSLGNALPNGNSPIVDVACPAGSYVGGGGLNAGGSYSFTEMWDAPTDTQTWRSEVFNGNPYHTLVAQTQFVCLKLG